MNEYEVRDAVLREMGYASYQQYLDSDLWWEIRGRAMARTAGRCVRCRATATEVHHSSYAVEVLQGYNILPLLPVCHPCHTLAEFNPSGAKRFDPREINAILTPLPTVKHTPHQNPKSPAKNKNVRTASAASWACWVLGNTTAQVGLITTNGTWPSATGL